ncbi:MAG: winged helix-turn-helix transcriptional regulator [Hyphomicrobiales bacterium]|nr:winged helix-turn-helix transcriptional regulator [Hyphomicrobiales bacterium]
MNKKPSEVVVRAWVRLAKAQQIALAAIENALNDADLPPLVWYDVLLEVERAKEKGIRPFELERAMLLAQYNLSRLLDRIERAGYVERAACVEDGRGQVIRITELGKSVRRRMWPVYAGAIERAVGEKLSANEALALVGLLGRLTTPEAGKSAGGA